MKPWVIAFLSPCSRIGACFTSQQVDSALFSGIIEEVGKVVKVTDSADGRRLQIHAPEVVKDVKLGDSISCNGTCLTVVEFDKDSFDVEAVWETLRRTNLGNLGENSSVNLERALKFSDRLGGHLVSGHVDAIATVSNIEKEGFSSVITFELTPELAPFFVEKGSVAISGVSLTVVDFPQDSKEKFAFRVALIPHTLSVTTFGELKVGDQVNIETDIVARYVARWLAPSLGLDAARLPFLAGAPKP
ncbi:MAG TPA: riboflavin synthase [Drouetiella sp.]